MYPLSIKLSLRDHSSPGNWMSLYRGKKDASRKNSFDVYIKYIITFPDRVSRPIKYQVRQTLRIKRNSYHSAEDVYFGYWMRTGKNLSRVS